MECILSLKRDAVKDVLCVIAYGATEARNVAINLLVYYWPHLNPTLYDRRSINFKFNGKTVYCNGTKRFDVEERKVSNFCFVRRLEGPNM